MTNWAHHTPQTQTVTTKMTVGQSGHCVVFLKSYLGDKRFSPDYWYVWQPQCHTYPNVTCNDEYWVCVLRGQPCWSRSVLLLEPPEGDLSVVAAGDQQSCLLWVPGDAVHILAVRLVCMSCQVECGLVWMGCHILLKHTHSIIPTGSRQGTSELTPKTTRNTFKALRLI